MAVSLGAQTKRHEAICSALMGISSGRTRVVDMTYALNDHSPAWPGDAHPFEAVTNASPAKEATSLERSPCSNITAPTWMPLRIFLRARKHSTRYPYKG